MSATQDDYGLTHGKSGTFSESHGVEPADPSDPDHVARRGLPLAPPSVRLSAIPESLRDDEGPLAVRDASTAYLKTQRASWQSEDRTSKYERHRYEVYPRILKADRRLQDRYDGLTTAMLTRRLSPLDDNGNWLTPWECDEMLHGGSIRRSVREALNYQLGDFDFEWVAVTAPTRSAGTPHEHIYLWIDDLENRVGTGHLESALGKHLKYCANAYEKDHRYRVDGTSGAITVRHNPEIVKSIPERIHDILKVAESPSRPNTQGAQYTASQLAHLPVGDYYQFGRENPPDPLIEGAALAWTSPHHWFRTSAGLPERRR